MRLSFLSLLALGLCACGVHGVRAPVTGGRNAWDAGEMGVEMRLTPVADSLAGYANLVFWHMGGSDPAPLATVSMVPVPCA